MKITRTSNISKSAVRFEDTWGKIATDPIDQMAIINSLFEDISQKNILSMFNINPN